VSGHGGVGLHAAVSLGLLPYVLMSELYPAAIRALGMSLAAATAWGVNAVVSLSFLPLMDAVGVAPVCALFAAVCAMAFVYTKRVVGEHPGRARRSEGRQDGGRRSAFERIGQDGGLSRDLRGHGNSFNNFKNIVMA